MARRSPLLAACAALCLLAPQFVAPIAASHSARLSSADKEHVFSTIRRQLLADQEDLAQNLEVRSTRRLLQEDATVPITDDGHSVALPQLGSLGGVLDKINELVEKSSVLGHFPWESFPGLGTTANRFGFAPTNDSFCLFASNGKGSKPALPADCAAAAPAEAPTVAAAPGPVIDAVTGAEVPLADDTITDPFTKAAVSLRSAAAPSTGPHYGYGYPGAGIPNYGGYSPAPYYNGRYSVYGGYGHYNIVDLRGNAPDATFPYGLPQPLANLINVLGAELHCVLGPVLPDSTPAFPIFLEVLLEDAVSVYGQFLKYLTSDFSKLNPLDTDLIYLRNPFDPYGTPLKFEFSLADAVKEGLEPLGTQGQEALQGTQWWGGAVDPNPAISPVAAALPAGDAIRAVAYDGYLDSCQVILGTQPGSDGTFDKVSDFAGTVTDGAWSVDLDIVANSTGDVAYVVPAAKTNAYGQLTLETRKSAGYCYDVATLLPTYNPLAVPIPEDIDIYNRSLSASSLSTVLVFGNAFGLDAPGLKTAFGIDQSYDFALWDALDEAQKDPWSPGGYIFRESIKVDNVVTLGANLLTNDSSTYASFAVLLYQSVARAAVGATNLAAKQNFKNLNGPALNLDSATTIQDIYYGAISWVGTTSDQTLPSALSSADSRAIYAAALAANNLNALADHANNATDIQKTSYLAQSVVVPQLLEVLSGASTVDEFQALTSYDALWEAQGTTELPGSLTIPPAVAPTVPVTADNTAQAATDRSAGSDGLSGGAIAGIVIGVVVGAGLIAAAGAVAAKRMRARHYPADTV